MVAGGERGGPCAALERRDHRRRPGPHSTACHSHRTTCLCIAFRLPPRSQSPRFELYPVAESIRRYTVHTRTLRNPESTALDTRTIQPTDSTFMSDTNASSDYFCASSAPNIAMNQFRGLISRIPSPRAK